MISVVTEGNGSAYVSNPYPTDGGVFTLYAYPDTDWELTDIIAEDYQGYSIAVYVQEEQDIEYNEDWGDVLITVTFAYVEPPVRAKRKHMPIWMYPILRQRR